MCVHCASKIKNGNHFLTMPVTDHCSLFLYSFNGSKIPQPSSVFPGNNLISKLIGLQCVSRSLAYSVKLFTKSRQIFKNSSHPIPTATLVAAPAQLSFPSDASSSLLPAPPVLCPSWDRAVPDRGYLSAPSWSHLWSQTNPLVQVVSCQHLFSCLFQLSTPTSSEVQAMQGLGGGRGI